MAIALDANLGQASANGPAFPYTGLTTSAVAAGAVIFLWVSWWSNTGEVLSTPTGGGLTWAVDYQHANASFDRFAIVSAQCPAGAASVTPSLSWTGSASPLDGGLLVAAASFTGLLASGHFDKSATNDTSGTTWTTGAASNAQADSLYIAGTGLETATTSTNTWGSGSEIHDFWLAAAQQGLTTGYEIVSSIASRSYTGTVSPTSSASTTGLAIYKADVAAAPPAIEPRRDFEPARFGPF